jgi:hypothetical protein
MVQVGCTNNYGRRCLWKQTEKSRALTIPEMWAKMIQHFPRSRLVGLRHFCRNRGPVAQLGARFHGMEEVVGSIPTRSTKSLNNLDGASARKPGVCVMVCVITRRSGAHGKGFHRYPLRFHPHVAVPLQHATADVSSNRHDR